MRLRTAQGKLKIEHSIIDGLRPVLETLLAQNSQIKSVIPGVIRPVRDARGLKMALDLLVYSCIRSSSEPSAQDHRLAD